MLVHFSAEITSLNTRPFSFSIITLLIKEILHNHLFWCIKPLQIMGETTNLNWWRPNFWTITSWSKWWQHQELIFNVGRNHRKIYKDDFNNLDFTQEESAFSYQTLSRCLQNLPKTDIKSTWKVSARDSGSSRFLKSELVSFCCEMYGLRCWKQKTLLMSCS